MKTGLFVLVWNESLMLPHFMKYYIHQVDFIEIFDNGSTDDSIEELKKNYGDTGKIKIHDVSEFRGLRQLSEKVQNEMWCELSKKYDVLIHVDVDEFIVSDKKDNLKTCLEDFFKSPANFVKVKGYEAALNINRQFVPEDNIVEMAKHGFLYSLMCRPCIIKPKLFKEWNLTWGRHGWDPKLKMGVLKQWERRPILKHIRGANLEFVVQKRMDTAERIMKCRPNENYEKSLRKKFKDFYAQYKKIE